MMDIGAAVVRASRADALWIQRTKILGEARVPDIDRPVSGERLAGAAGTGREYAVEHVHAADDGADNVVRLADTHQVTRLVGGKLARREVEDAEHGLLPLADRQAADRVAVEIDVDQRIRRGFAKSLIQCALLNSKLRCSRRMLATAKKGVPRPLCPAHGALHRLDLHLAR